MQRCSSAYVWFIMLKSAGVWNGVIEGLANNDGVISAVESVEKSRSVHLCDTLKNRGPVDASVVHMYSVRIFQKSMHFGSVVQLVSVKVCPSANAFGFRPIVHSFDGD